MSKPEKPERCDDRALFDLTHARHDPAHCLTPGLFRSLKRGQRKKEKLDVAYEFSDGRRIEFSGPEPLGVDDLRVLQGLVAMGGPSGLVLSPEPHTASGEQLRLGLDLKWDALKQDALVTRGSYRALAREIGYAYDGGAQFRSIRESIERLWKVSIIVQIGRRRRGSRLLSEYASDEERGQLYVALNCLIAKAIMGGAQHVRIPMAEVRALRGDIARLLHQRLCAWINPGVKGRVGTELLCTYAWPDSARSPGTQRTRRRRVREAVKSLTQLGWTVKEYARSKWEIGRPADESEIAAPPVTDPAPDDDTPGITETLFPSTPDTPRHN